MCALKDLKFGGSDDQIDHKLQSNLLKGKIKHSRCFKSKAKGKRRWA